MLVYSRTTEYRHDAAIEAGRVLLQQIADEQGFAAVLTEDHAFLADLASFELVFFLNPSGRNFNNDERKVFEAWMTAGGAFAGVHGATDTENGWAFYSDVTGQYHNGHGFAHAPGTVVLDPRRLAHPAVQGLPSAWERHEEWFLFKTFAEWSAQPGFQILASVAAPGEPYDGHPVSWVREWGGFRSFYTSLGHDRVVYEDLLVKKHLTGGIMWAVRREHLIK
jgi:type 1 glutamine amidotransferase